MYPLSLGIVIGAKALWDELQASLAELPVRIVVESAEIQEWPALLDKLERARPDVVFIDTAAAPTSLADAVERLRASAAAPAVFALHSSPDPALILEALRAGASEYLFPPFKDSLESALERVSAERNRQKTRPGGRAIGFVSAKGGCGATTVACNIAVALAQKTARKVLLADFDLDAGMVAFLMKTKSPYTVLDAFNNVQRLDANYWKALISNGTPHLEVISSPPAPACAHGVTPDQIRFVLRFGRTQYDWLVLDLGRSLNEFSFRVMEELDQIYLITTLEVPALHQAKALIQRILDAGYASHRLRVLLNRAPKRSEITLDELRSMLGIPVYAAIANDYRPLQDSYAEGKLAPPGSLIARHLDELAQKIAGLDGPRAKKKFSIF